MQCHVCRNIHSPASTIHISTFSFLSSNFPSPGSAPHPSHTHSSPPLFSSHPLLHFMFLPSNPAFCLSSKASHTFPSFHRSNLLSTAFQSPTKQGYKVTNISSTFLFLSQKLEAIKINLILVFNIFCSKTSAQR